jgi:site-specific DNA-methyltransferase (adenine-specific)
MKTIKLPEVHGKVIRGDCLDVMRKMPSKSVDLIVGSPPYEAQREYAELQFDLKGEDWVEWMVIRMEEMLRISKGLVVMVVEGFTKGHKYSATPILLQADLHRAGYCLRKPCVFYRCGILGGGGNDWLRNDWEFVICVTETPGPLPWSNPTATGKPSKTRPPKHRKRVTLEGEKIVDKKKYNLRVRVGTGLKKGDKTLQSRPREGAEKTNPGNVIQCTTGGHQMGSDLAHGNEAPYPEKLAAFFVRSFCPPGGIVYDPFSGSGTTAAVCVQHGRGFIVSDIRKSQVQLTLRRIHEAKTKVGVFTYDTRALPRSPP